MNKNEKLHKRNKKIPN